MNILIIDDLLLMGKENSFLSRFCKENKNRRILTAKNLSQRGENILLVRAKAVGTNEKAAFVYSENNGISELCLNLPCKKSKGLPLKELICFNKLLCANGESIAGLFKPDAVICGQILPLAIYGCEKIAKSCGALLLSESACDPKQLLQKSGEALGISPAALLVQKAFAAVQSKSDGVIGLFAGALSKIKTKRFYPFNYPVELSAEKPGQKALLQREALASFCEGNCFLLVCPSRLEKGYGIPELITLCGELGDKFALVFTNSGAQKAAYKKFTAEKSITNCFFFDEVEEKDIPFVLGAAECIFLAENSVLKGCAAEENEFILSMAAAKPVIAAAEYNADFFRKSCGAVITKPHKKESLRLGIKTLLNMSTEDKEMLGLCSKDFAKKHTPQKYCEDLLLLIDSLKKEK